MTTRLHQVSKRAADVAAAVSLTIGTLLLTFPDVTSTALALASDRKRARVIGAADLIVGAGLTRRAHRRNWMLARAALNAALAIEYRQPAADRSAQHRRRLSQALATLTILDTATAFTHPPHRSVPLLLEGQSLPRTRSQGRCSPTSSATTALPHEHPCPIWWELAVVAPVSKHPQNVEEYVRDRPSNASTVKSGRPWPASQYANVICDGRRGMAARRRRAAAWSRVRWYRNRGIAGEGQRRPATRKRASPVYGSRGRPPRRAAASRPCAT